ncbi:MAG: M23 family metallopeptidase [Saprospirales bacterium]|nr:MAG: M23 family metallopeptidase [Saprospirales bacterium]
MKQKKYVYNTSTLRFEEYKVSTSAKIYRVLGVLSSVVITAAIIYGLGSTYFPTPREQALERELELMSVKYLSFKDNLETYSKVLNNLRERDDGVYRMLFGMDPLDGDMWEGGIGGHNRLGDNIEFNFSGQLVNEVQNRLDRLERQLVMHSRSLETIEELSEDRENMLASIPSIKPIRMDNLHRSMNLLSGFGMRLHPVHKVWRMHTGIDFTAPLGTPIYATGNGVVTRIQRDRTGYGTFLVVNHGYGYETLYAHLRDYSVEVGDEVTKGQKIATVGNTGTSTAPHLHYEVRYRGNPVNPVYFCMDGLSPAEYQELVEMASIPNQSFGD